jgi:hypothetical protein
MSHRAERYSRELRRFNLALRMVGHAARTHTICSWTGLTKPRVQDVSRSYWAARDVTKRDRLSGPSPSALNLFWKSQRLQREAAAMAGLFRMLGVLPAGTTPYDIRRLPDLQRGEQLCLAYETYLSFVPEPRISLEHAVLLVTALVRGTEIALERCVDCDAVVLIERLDTSRPRCAGCKPDLHTA